jgi:hypothetical protein
MAGRRLVSAERQNPGGRGPNPQSLVCLASRLLIAQAGASAAIGLAYNRRNVPWLLLTVLVAVALCWLAVVIRSGSHTAWLGTVSVEGCIATVGLYRFVYDRYLGGTLLAIITLGVLLHPAVTRAFAVAPGQQPVGDHPGISDGASDVLQGGAAS